MFCLNVFSPQTEYQILCNLHGALIVAFQMNVQLC